MINLFSVLFNQYIQYLWLEWEHKNSNNTKYISHIPYIVYMDHMKNITEQCNDVYILEQFIHINLINSIIIQIMLFVYYKYT